MCEIVFGLIFMILFVDWLFVSLLGALLLCLFHRFIDFFFLRSFENFD